MKDKFEWTKGPVTGFCNDTRVLKAGDVFLALHLKGGRDGHEFLADAAAKEAVGAIVERVNPKIALPQLQVEDTLVAFQKIARGYRESFKGTVIGVTGSCGKTSTKDLLALLLGRHQTLATKVNLNNFLGVPLTITGIDSLKHKFAIIEAGISVVGEMQGIAECMQPDYMVLTGIEPVHLEGLGSLEGIAAQKCLLAKYTKQRIFLPARCLKLHAVKELNVKKTVIFKEGESLSLDNVLGDISVFCYSYEREKGGMLLKITDKEQGTHRLFHVPEWTNGMVSNGCLAILMASELGVSSGDIQQRLMEWSPPPHRGEVFEEGNKTYYVDCYNANPVATWDRIECFRIQSEGKSKLLVLGAMGGLGKNTDQLHFELGEKIAKNQKDDETIVIIDEKAAALKDGLFSHHFPEKRIFFCKTKEEAKPIIDSFSGHVLIKGSHYLCLWELLPCRKMLF
ncbi:MAG: hypothetical protein A2007_04515 [Verrucomicrobia bacterium GWC2_42_7]|nr:MAG: hypothetical protein A2007_04515 [Verrucomicrobia bacterium GWC2_42_7]